MALSRRNGKRFEANIWPGFVDAMTALLLVLMFVLSIFMIVQFMLSEKITSQDGELNQLTGEVATLAQALGLEQQRSFGLEQDIEQLAAAAAQQAAAGARAVGIVVGTRYIHTVTEMVEKGDLQAALDILVAYLLEQ